MPDDVKKGEKDLAQNAGMAVSAPASDTADMSARAFAEDGDADRDAAKKSGKSAASSKAGNKGKPSREERLAEALRANLRRRKAASKARQS